MTIGGKLRCRSPASPWPENSDLVPKTTVTTFPAPPLVRALDKRPDLNLTGYVVVQPSAQSLDGGGFGDVYEGFYKDPKTGETSRVAIKRLRNKIGPNDDELAKFKKGIAREIRIWSELEHPNVMHLLGYIIEGSFPSLVSVWMNYGSLYTYMSRGKLHGKSSLSMVLDIACGLAYMHSRSAIHSDLKSDNVLVSPDKRGLLSDFGASRMETLSSGYSTRNAVGSIQWMAAELFPKSMDDDRPMQFTLETDVWAFGMTVYEILSKERPYAHIQHGSLVMWCISKGGLPKKLTISEDPFEARIENFLWSLCEDCWKIPKERPTMSDIERRIRSEIDCIES